MVFRHLGLLIFFAENKLFYSVDKLIVAQRLNKIMFCFRRSFYDRHG